MSGRVQLKFGVRRPDQGLGIAASRKEESPGNVSVRVLRHQEEIRRGLRKAWKRYQRNARADFATRKSLQRLHRRVRLEVRDDEQRHAGAGLGSEEGFDGENFRLKIKSHQHLNTFYHN